jgi:hypothetical protein
MNNTTFRFQLAPAGYLIVQDSEDARLSNPYREKFGVYYGVDRLPPFIAPDPAIRALLGQAPVVDPVLKDALHQWFESRSGETAFIRNGQRALDLLNVFRTRGFRLELLFCELACGEGEEERVSAYGSLEGARLPMSLQYGFDVSWPGCNHSAIIQPGIVPNSACWRGKLNEYGLLSDYDDGLGLRSAYLAIYPNPPFDIFLVSKAA